MQLSIIGCPDKKRFRPYVKRATQFYVASLISKKMSDNIYLQLKFNKDLDVFGYASVEEYNNSGKPREFLIEIHPGIGAKNILKTIAHELVHVKQYLRGETNEALTRWKGARISDDLDYYLQPWEIEAYGLETGLFANFVIKEKLYDVFDEIDNPDTPIVSVPISWVQNCNKV